MHYVGPIAVYPYAGDQIIENVTTGFFYYQDSLGNTSRVTDEVGNLTWTRDPRWYVTVFGYRRTGEAEPNYEGNLMASRPGGNLNSEQVEGIVHPGIGGTVRNIMGLLGQGGEKSFDERWGPDSGTGNWQADQYTNNYLRGGGENSGEGFHPAGPR